MPSANNKEYVNGVDAIVRLTAIPWQLEIVAKEGRITILHRSDRL